MRLHLISHKLCPYVQRAVIALIEKDVPFRRTDVDLAAKPDWFLDISPLGKTPVLVVDGQPIFESAVILEFLEETLPRPLHPSDPMLRARHRGWIEVASAILADIAGFYRAGDADAFSAKRRAMTEKFARIEDALGQGPLFAGEDLSLVDVAFGPVFRYFDVFDRIDDFGVFKDKPRTAAWRRVLAARPSVKAAVSEDYPLLLRQFLERLESHLASLMTSRTRLLSHP